MSEHCQTCGDANSTNCQTCMENEKPIALQASEVKKVIAVMSGKGGVGKSSVTALLAVGLAKEGFKVGILDADITGPSIPRMLGLTERIRGSALGMVPPASRLGIKVMSMNLLLPQEDEPVIWRGPLIAGAVKQFWEEVFWGELDYLLVDLPPGTGDVPLTVMQSLPVSGIVVVSSPQELVQMVVKKAVQMAKKMGVPLLGLVENMSYVLCPNCQEAFEVFGPSRVEQIAESLGIRCLGRVPIDPDFNRLADAGRVEHYQGQATSELVGKLLEIV